MKIGTLARITNTSIRSLRYYESEGLLDAARDASGHRSYAENDVGRVDQIGRFFSAGLCSRRIRELIQLVSDPGCASSNRLDELITVERARLSAELQSARARLDQFEVVAASLRGLQPAERVRSEAPAPAYHLKSTHPD